MRVPILISGLLLISLSTVSSSQSQSPEDRIGGFSLYKNADNCTILASYSNGETVVLKYNAKTKDATLGFTNKNATSLTEKDEKGIEVDFLNGRKLDDGWGETNFSVTVERDGSRLFVSQPLDPELLTDFAKNRTIAFFYSKKLIGSYALDGSSKAVPALKACAMKVAGYNPKDPFAE